MKKAQAAMEFLMTYGWAILALLISISALAYFGVLSPGRFSSNTCTLFPGVACTDSKIEATQIILTVRNGIGYELKDVSITSPTKCTGPTTIDPVSTSLAEGITYTVTLTGCSGLTEGSKINEDITIIYTEKALSHTRTGKIAGIVESTATTTTTSTTSSTTSTTTTSTTTTTIPPCSGSVVLSYTANPVVRSTADTAIASGMSNCDGKSITFRTVSCSGTSFASCTSGSTGCSVGFTSPPSPASYNTYACIDINGDTDFIDAGESDLEVLVVT